MAKVTKVEEKRRGRPTKYAVGTKLSKHVASLVRKHGATHAREILHAANGTELASIRSANIFPEPSSISMPVILKLAKAEGVELKPGRPKGSVKVVAADADAAKADKAAAKADKAAAKADKADKKPVLKKKNGKAAKAAAKAKADEAAKVEADNADATADAIADADADAMSDIESEIAAADAA